MDEDARFDKAAAFLLAHEGGYVNDPADPGGETNFGISKRSYPTLDIARLTEDQARALYRRDFWDAYGYARFLNGDVAAKVMDLAVNMGPARAHLLLQRALRAGGTIVVEDGLLGPQTLGAVNGSIGHVLLAALRSEAAGHYRLLAERKSSRARFLDGWLRRAYA